MFALVISTEARDYWSTVIHRIGMEIVNKYSRLSIQMTSFVRCTSIHQRASFRWHHLQLDCFLHINRLTASHIVYCDVCKQQTRQVVLLLYSFDRSLGQSIHDADGMQLGHKYSTTCELHRADLKVIISLEKMNCNFVFAC